MSSEFVYDKYIWFMFIEYLLMAIKKRGQKEQLIHIAVTLLIPVLIMTKLNGADALWPIWSLVVALLFPLGYQWYERLVKKKIDVFSVIGFVSILLTGGIWLLALDAQWIAVKEAGVPLVLGLVVAGSIVMNKSLVNAFLDQALDREYIYDGVDTMIKTKIDRLYKVVSRWFAWSFLISSVLNYILARVIMTAEAGTAEFTAQLGKMTGLSLPVIALPMVVMMTVLLVWFVMKLQKLTGKELESLVRS